MKKIYISVLAALLFAACDKTAIEEPVFDVTVDKTTYKLGDTVRFKFSGNTDYLSMYSGEAGSKYEYKDRIKADGQVLMNISANLRNTNGVKSLSILATTDLNPLRDSADVVNAPWVDISDRFNIPTTNTGVGVPIGTADLTDLKKDGKPLFLALKVYSPNSTTAVQPRWTITVLNLTNNLPDGTSLSIAGRDNAGWKAISVKNKAYSWITSGGLYTNAPAINSGDNENWAVSGPLYVDAIARDYPTSIKDIITVMPQSFEYIYKAKGTYKVVFVGLNSRNGNSSSISKELEIKIE